MCVVTPLQVIVTQLHGVQAILHILLNVKDREDVIEPAVCTLRHLTSRHVNAEMAQMVLRENFGIPVLVNFLQPQYKWPLIKVGCMRHGLLHPWCCAAGQCSACMGTHLPYMHETLYTSVSKYKQCMYSHTCTMHCITTPAIGTLMYGIIL